MSAPHVSDELMRLWAVAVVGLHLHPSDFWMLTPVELRALVEAATAGRGGPGLRDPGAIMLAFDQLHNRIQGGAGA